MEDHITYRNLVDNWVTDKAAHQIEWPALLESLPSVYPATVRDSAMKGGVWGNVRHSELPREARKVGSRACDLWKRGILTTPHVLDGCWWFTDETLRTLADWACRLSAGGDLVALFGAPTLFHYIQAETTDREVVLIDRCAGTAVSEHRVEADLLQFQPKLQRPASVIVVDPPWYGPEMRAFLSAARSNVARGATILLSVPPVGTRPGIPLEWTDLTHWCEGVGLRLIEYLPLALRYLSPSFEVNALRADDVPSCPLDWRRGDLAIFECDEGTANSSTTVSGLGHRPWHDVEIGRVRLKIKLDEGSECTSPILEEIVPGDVLPSVSRRDERLSRAVLWTSGNRILGSRAGKVLRRIVEALATSRSPMVLLKCEMGTLDSSGLNEIELTTNRLRRIIELEELELEVWGRSLNASLVEVAS